MALKLVLEPIFEADFYPSSYGYRPARRAQDAIAEIVHFTNDHLGATSGSLEADIEACFDRIASRAQSDGRGHCAGSGTVACWRSFGRSCEPG